MKKRMVIGLFLALVLISADNRMHGRLGYRGHRG